jgi:MATE family multidrug resistance protein
MVAPSPSAAPADDAPTTRFGAELAAIVSRSLPLALAQIGLMAMGLADNLIVGRTETVTGLPSADALAAVGLGDSYVMSILLFGMGVAMGLDPVASQRLGAGDARGARRALGHALLAGVALTPLLYGAVWLLDHFLLLPNAEGRPPSELLRAEPAVAAAAREYAWARSIGVYPWIAFAALRSWFYAKHLTRPMIVVIIGGNVANIVLDWLFVFGDAGLRYLGLPETGLRAYGPLGAGMVTGIVNILMVLALVPYVLRERRREEAEAAAHPPPADARASGNADAIESRLAGMARILKLGLPIAAQTVLEVLIFNLVAVMTPRYGKELTAAHQIAIRVASFTFMATTGVGAAAAVRVGRAIGAARLDAARIAGFASITVGALWMTACGAALLLFPATIAGWFIDDPRTVAAAAPLLRIAAVFQIFDGVQAVASGALRGAGDTRLPFIANFIAYWAIGAPVAFVLKEHYGVAGLWWGLSAGLAVVAVLLTWRFSRLTARHVARVG